MPYRKVQAEKLSQAVVRQLELLVLRGILRPGERLPAERDLAQRFGVSRPILRDALADLQDRKILVGRPSAGVYVADVLGSAFNPALIKMFAAHEEALFDYISFRRDLESLAAERAAQLGTETDLELIATIFAKMEAAHKKCDPTDEAQLDAEFHMAIIDASHNVVMLHMMRSMFDLLRQGVFYNRQVMFKNKTTREELLSQHRAIHLAIQSRDRVASRQTVSTHLDYVEQSLSEQSRLARHEDIAVQKLEHEKTR